MNSAIQRAYKTELDLNHAQITACKQHAGAARWAYNWGLQRKQDAYRTTGASLSAVDLHRELNALKKTEVPWMYAVSKCAPQEALRNLDTAFANFFRRAKLKQHGQWRGKVGHPQRKTRKQGLGSFRLTGTIVVVPDGIQLPRLGRLRLKERGYLPTAAAGDAHTHILSATVSEEAGHWYVSLLVEVEQRPVIPENAESAGHTGPVVGVDLGVKALATLSDGTVIPNPRPLKRKLKQLKRMQRAVSRKRKGSQNRKKAVRRLARLHRRIAHQRANTLHQLTSRLAKTKSVVVVEDLNVAGMLKNHHLAQAIADVGFGEFRRQLTYKAGWYGCRVVVVSRWEPSSKTCSGCGAVKAELALAERVYHCVECGLMLDRDLNTARNLSKLAVLVHLAGSSSDSQNACGGESAGPAAKPWRNCLQ